MNVRVYDWQGSERDLAYLKARYGDFVIHPAAQGDGPAFRISVLREKVNTAATLVVRVTTPAGVPLEGIPVAFYWPDAPQDANAGPLGGVPPQLRGGRAVVGFTSVSGDTGFGMGRGAYFFPAEGQLGPHATWIYGAATRSDVILGLGMIGETNHDHFDVEYVRVEEETIPGPGTECPKEEIEAQLAKIEEAIAAIRTLLG